MGKKSQKTKWIVKLIHFKIHIYMFLPRKHHNNATYS